MPWPRMQRAYASALAAPEVVAVRFPEDAPPVPLELPQPAAMTPTASAAASVTVSFVGTTRRHRPG